MRQKTFPVIDPAATGANIVRLRRARGLSVRDLQAYFGFEEPQAIYKWQKGKSLPSVDNLYALGALLEVPMEEILVSTDSKWNELVCEQQADACCSGLSISPPAKGFGGKDSVKGNRQGSLSHYPSLRILWLEGLSTASDGVPGLCPGTPSVTAPAPF